MSFNFGVCGARSSILAAVMGIGLMAGQSHAAIVFSNGITGSDGEASDNGSDTSFPGFPVSNSDLLQGLTPDVTLSYLGPNPGAESTNPNPAPLTDGNFGGYSNPLAIFATSSVASSSNYTTLYYILDSVPGGYDITAIDTYTSMNRGSGRNRQDYIVSYATVADPSVDDFTKFVEVHAVYHPGSQHVHLSIDNLTGVTALKFEFPDQIAGYVGYREIDVIGTAVPEPSTVALAGVAGLGTLARRRRMA